MAVAANINVRTNRDEDMNYFAAYYAKSEFDGTMFKQFKQLEHHDAIILGLLRDAQKREKLRCYIKN